MEKYLDQCVDSLLIPEIDKIEILIINDGSKDKTSDIGHSYEDKYPNSIKCIDKKNGNYGSCINCGLSIATGKYIKILDADDYFNKLNLNEYVQRLNDLDADCIITNYQKVNPKGEVIRKFDYNDIPKNHNLKLVDIENVLLRKLVMHAVTYKTSILKKIQYHQTEGISYTDIEWIYTPIAASEKIIYIPLMIYNYLIGREGQTIDPKVYAKRINDTITGIKTQTEILERLTTVNSSIHKIYLKRKLSKRLLRLYSTILIDSQNNRNLLAELDKEFHLRWEQLGISITQLTHPVIGKKSYIQKWREDNYNNNFKISLFYKFDYIAVKLLSRIFPDKGIAYLKIK